MKKPGFNSVLVLATIGAIASLPEVQNSLSFSNDNEGVNGTKNNNNINNSVDNKSNNRKATQF